MTFSPRLLLTVLLIFGMSSCAVKKGGKRHKKPSKGGGKGCDCPGLGQSAPADAMFLHDFRPQQG